MRANASFAVGLLFVLFGVFFLVVTLFAGYERMDVLWPFFPLSGGLFLLCLSAATRRRAGRAALVFTGSVPFLLGMFFLLFTSHLFAWRDQSYLWPAYPFIVGLGFVAAYMATLRRQAFWLIPAVPTLGVGIVGFFFTLPLAPWWRDGVARFWPIVLVIAGLFLLLRRRTGTPHSERPAA